MSAAIRLYTRELGAAAEAARSAGALLRETRDRALTVREKADRTLVTNADLAGEDLILAALREAFPADGIVAEEAGVFGEKAGRVWIVDPLDGTTNYTRGLPFFAVSIALWERGEPVVGAVYLPVLDELFAAAAGEPATLNGQPIRVSETGSVRDAMVNVYFDRHTRLQDGLEVLGRVAPACEGRVKNMGSTASMLCYVACGRLDAFVKNSTKLWDFAAGALVLAQAGGRLTDFDEQPLTHSDQSLLATNGKIHDELAMVIRAN